MKTTDTARRKFMGTLAVLFGYAGLGPLQLSAQDRARQTSDAAKAALPDPRKAADYDKLVKLANNENVERYTQARGNLITDRNSAARASQSSASSVLPRWRAIRAPW